MQKSMSLNTNQMPIVLFMKPHINQTMIQASGFSQNTKAMPERLFITPSTNPMPVSLCTSQNIKVMHVAGTSFN